MWVEIFLKVLIVDDSKVMRRILASFLQKIGCWQVIEASSVGSGLVILENENLDLVLSDLSMPGLTGMDLLEAVRCDRVHCNTPFVMISAEAELGRIIAAFRGGANYYITKPFSREYFEYIIKRCLV